MTEQDWYKALSKEGEDRVTLLAFADWCEEKDECRKAQVLRQIADKGYSPLLARSYSLSYSCVPYNSGIKGDTDGWRSFDWWDEQTDRADPLSHKKALLPIELLLALERPKEAAPYAVWSVKDPTYREYPSRPAAFRALVTAMLSLEGVLA